MVCDSCSRKTSSEWWEKCCTPHARFESIELECNGVCRKVLHASCWHSRLNRQAVGSVRSAMHLILTVCVDSTGRHSVSYSSSFTTVSFFMTRLTESMHKPAWTGHVSWKIKFGCPCVIHRHLVFRSGCTGKWFYTYTWELLYCDHPKNQNSGLRNSLWQWWLGFCCHWKHLKEELGFTKQENQVISLGWPLISESTVLRQKTPTALLQPGAPSYSSKCNTHSSPTTWCSFTQFKM